MPAIALHLTQRSACIARKLRSYRFGGAHDYRIYLAISCRYWRVRLALFNWSSSSASQGRT